MKLAWGARVSAEFRDREIRVAEQIGCDPSDLMACMAFETGRTFDPAKRNPVSSATGLIGFMRATALDLNTTVEALAKMSAVEQLDYVARYFQRYAGRIHSLSDLYMAILWPIAVGRPDSEAIFKAGTAAYEANKGLDVNKDGIVTKGEAAAFVVRMLAEGMQPGNVYIGTDASIPTPPTGGAVIQSEPSRMDPLSLVSMLVSVFAPKIRTQADKVLGTDVGSPLVDKLLGMAQLLTGKTDPLEAVAVARQNPAIVAKMEEATDDWFKQIAPAVDKIAALEKQEWESSEESMDRGAARYVGAAYDPAKMLTYFSVVAVGLLTIFMCVWITILHWNGDSVPTELWAALTGMIGWLTAKLGSIYDNRFGTTRQSAAKDVTIAEMARRAK